VGYVGFVNCRLFVTGTAINQSYQLSGSSSYAADPVPKIQISNTAEVVLRSMAVRLASGNFFAAHGQPQVESGYVTRWSVRLCYHGQSSHSYHS
jgi:hypothetical protein